MKRVVGAAMLALVACGSDATSRTDGGSDMSDVPGGVGEPANLAGITQFHNEVRAATGASPALPPMQWDPDLAAYAEAWVKQCKDGGDPITGLVDHNPALTNVAGYAVIGENIFGSGMTATARIAVDTWAAEKENYRYPQGCDSFCGHYLQIVWRTSVNLGCAANVCKNLTYGNTIVCNYGPGASGTGLPY
jgi:pathogenesis-related protein 1